MASVVMVAGISTVATTQPSGPEWPSLRLAWPDDLYILASPRMLKRIRGAIDQALAKGIGYSGDRDDFQRRQVIVIPMEPRCE